MKEPLTLKQTKVYDFIKNQIKSNNISPTIMEICRHFEYKSPKAAVDILNILEKKNWIVRTKSKSRSILINEEINLQSDSVLKLIIAGEFNSLNPFSIFANPSGFLFFDKNQLGNGNFFVAKVSDNSLKKDGIEENDFAIIKQNEFDFKNKIVLLIYNEKLILRIYKDYADRIELISSDSRFPKILIAKNSSQLNILGVLVKLIKNY